MQVWSTRKRAAEELAKPASAKGVGHSAADAWALRVLAGVHAGAERKLQERSLLMIGSSDDCDIIFSDAGVAAHHCIVTRADGELSVRAVDAEVRIDDHVLHPGDPQEIKPFALLRIGATCFALGPHWSDRWQSLLSQIEATPPAIATADQVPPRQRSGKAMTLGIAMVLMLASAGALVLAQHNAKPPPAAVPVAARDGELRAMIGTLGYEGLRVTTRSDGVLVVNGYAERNEDLANLRAQLDQRGLKAEIDAKSGPQIEADVAESFRLSSLPVKAKWTGKAVVEVRGRFGDRTKLMEVLNSRIIQELNKNLGLKVAPINLDPEKPKEKVPDGKRIRQIVDGADPYMISADGSRYYVEGKLPNGGTFAGIENGEILVRDDAGNIQRLPRESVVDASP